MHVVETLLRRAPGFLVAVIVPFVGLGCASSSLGSGSAIAPEGVDLSGSWVLNEEESDDASQLGQMAQGSRSGEGGMPGGMTGGRPPGGGGRGGGMTGGRPGGGGRPQGGRAMPQGSRIDPEKMRRTIQLARDPKRRLSIEQADSSVYVVTAWQEPLTIRFDGSELKREYDWGEMKVRAGWIGRGLTVEWEIVGGGKVLERYSLSTTTDQLFVVTRIEMGRMMGEPIEFRRVYDPAEQP